jgi:hypothetical protein
MGLLLQRNREGRREHGSGGGHPPGSMQKKSRRRCGSRTRASDTWSCKTTRPHWHTHTHHPVNIMPTPRLSRQRRDDRSLRRVGSGTGIVNVFVELHRVRELAGSQKRQRIKTHPEGHRVDEHREVLGPCRERPCRKRRQDFDGSCPTKEPHIREHTVRVGPRL